MARVPKTGSPVQRRIWAALLGLGQVRSRIRIAETARTARASLDYTRRYLKWLAGEGHLSGDGGRGYAVAKAAPLEAPRWTRGEEKG